MGVGKLAPNGKFFVGAKPLHVARNAQHYEATLEGVGSWVGKPTAVSYTHLEIAYLFFSVNRLDCISTHIFKVLAIIHFLQSIVLLLSHNYYDSPPVSYTHLDVYKRQDADTASDCTSAPS